LHRKEGSEGEYIFQCLLGIKKKCGHKRQKRKNDAQVGAFERVRKPRELRKTKGGVGAPKERETPNSRKEERFGVDRLARNKNWRNSKFNRITVEKPAERRRTKISETYHDFGKESPFCGSFTPTLRETPRGGVD